MRPLTQAEQIGNTVASSAPGAAVIAAGDTATGGHLDNLVGLGGGDAELANVGIQQTRQNHPYASALGDISAGASLYGAGRAATSGLARQFPRAMAAMGGAPGGQVAAFAPRAMAGDAALGGYIGSGQSGTDVFDPASAGMGAAFGAGGGIVGRGAINAAGGLVSPPASGRLGPVIERGTRPSLGQRVGGVVDRFEQATTSVPGLGAIPRNARNRAIEDFQVGAFNQALEDIGLQLPRRVGAGRPGGATRAHLFTQRAYDRVFDNVRRNSSFTPDGDWSIRFGQIMQDLETLPQDSQTIFRNLVEKDLASRLRRGGNQLSGDAYLRVASRIDRTARNIRKNPNGDGQLAELLEGVSEAMDEAAIRQSQNPNLAQQLASARRGYRKLVIIEDAARRRGSGQGEFSPPQFDAAVQNVGGGLRSRQYLSGQAPMQDYARAGLNLGDTVPNSGSIDRLLASGAVSAAGFANPWTLAPLGVSLGANLPGVRQGINAALRPRPGLAGLGSQIQNQSAYGGMAGAGLGLGSQAYFMSLLGYPPGQ
jgi:hypothetical protein